MSKIKIKSTLYKASENVSEKRTYALKNNNKIMFHESSDTFMKIEFNNSMVFMTRNNTEMNLKIKFQNDKVLKGTCDFIKLGLSIDIKTITKNLVIADNKIEIAYDMYVSDEYNGTFNYKLEWSDYV